MTRTRKQKFVPRTFWLLESEYGLDFKRHFRSICGSEAEALAKKRWLDIKDPYDKHEIICLVELKLKVKK